MDDQSALIQSLSEQIRDTRAKERFIKAARSVGRPTKYHPSFCTEILAHYAEGKSTEQVCADIGLSKSTYYNWTRDTEKVEFLHAHKKGKSLSRAYWDEIAQDNLDNRSFNFLLFESQYKRRHNCAEDSAVDLPGFQADAPYEDQVRSILEGIATKQITPDQGTKLMAMVRAAAEVSEIPQLKMAIDELRENAVS